MNSDDQKRLCRVEVKLDALIEKIDDSIIPRCVSHEGKLGAMEKALWVAYGAVFVVSSILLMAREVVVEWLKNRLS